MLKKLMVMITLFLVILTACSKQKINTEAQIIEELQKIQENLDNQQKTLDAQNKTVEEKPDYSNLTKIEAKEEELVKLKLETKDKDGDILTYSFSKPFNNDGEWQTKIGDKGEYVITVAASDGKNETKQKVLVIINEKIDKPTFLKLKPITVYEGETVIIKPEVLNATKPVHHTYSPPFDKDGKWQTDYNSAGAYSVQLTSRMAYYNNTQNVVITVLNKNRPPLLMNVPKEIEAEEGETITIKPKASDEDGDKVKITIEKPFINGSWTVTRKDAGKHSITVKAFDGKDTTKQIVKITVNKINTPPEIISITKD